MRALFAAVLLVAGWSLQEPSLLWMRVAGLYPLVTAGIGWCPVYALLRLSTVGSDRP